MSAKLFFAFLVSVISLAHTAIPALSRSSTKADAIVVYSATWCIPCQKLKPVLLKLKKLGYRVCIRDYDKIKSGEFRPEKVPAIYLFNGSKLLDSKGLNSRSSLMDFRSRMIKP